MSKSSSRLEEEIASQGDYESKYQKDLARIDQQRKNWGKNRESYYSSDTHDFETAIDQEAVREEETEIRRLQHQQAKQLQQMDLGLDALLGAKKKTSKKATSKQITSTLNPAQYTTEQKVQLVLEQSPELIGLVSQFFTYSEQCGEILTLLDVVPVLKEAIDITPILSLLRLRQQVLMSYSLAILFYLVLKTKQHGTSEHPVMTQLVNFQTLLELQDESFNDIRTQLLDAQTILARKVLQDETMSTKRSRSSDSSHKSISFSDLSETPEEYYRRIASQKKAENQEREALRKERKAAAKAAKQPAVSLSKTMVASDVQRKPSFKIIANKGLTRQMSKKQREASGTRIKMRQKHDKAMERRKSTVRSFKGKQDLDYVGEASIKKGLIRSIKLD